MTAATEVRRHAVLSDCGIYRYRLWRQWSVGPPLVFVMLNPSTADANTDDPTIRRCLRFAQDHGHGALEVVNLYAYRATDPRVLRAAGFPVGPQNDAHIEAAVRDAAAVCVAWGACPGMGERPGIVLANLRRLGVRLQCLATTRSGEPSHPLMLPASSRLSTFLETRRPGACAEEHGCR